MKEDFEKDLLNEEIPEEDIFKKEKSGGIIKWIHDKLVGDGVDKEIAKRELELNHGFVKKENAEKINNSSMEEPKEKEVVKEKPAESKPLKKTIKTPTAPKGVPPSTKKKDLSEEGKKIIEQPKKILVEETLDEEIKEEPVEEAPVAPKSVPQGGASPPVEGDINTAGKEVVKETPIEEPKREGLAPKGVPSVEGDINTEGKKPTESKPLKKTIKKPTAPKGVHQGGASTSSRPSPTKKKDLSEEGKKITEQPKEKVVEKTIETPKEKSKEKPKEKPKEKVVKETPAEKSKKEVVKEKPIVKKDGLANVEKITKKIDADYEELGKEITEKMNLWQSIGQAAKQGKGMLGELTNIFDEKTQNSEEAPVRNKASTVVNKRIKNNKVPTRVSKKISVKPTKNSQVKSAKIILKSDMGKSGVNVPQIAEEIMKEQIKKQRGSVKKTLDTVSNRGKGKKSGRKYVTTGIKGFDSLLIEGIPQKSTILVAGGTGSGKTIFCLQTMVNKIREGKKCLYMSFEEKEEKLIQHMEGFGWDPHKMIKEGNLVIQRTNPFDITRNVDALLAKQKGELLIDVDPVIIPKEFKADFIFLDSLTAIASAFTGKEENYRIYIEQLFRFFEKIGATSFLITETEQIPKIFSKTGVEEFLADGVIVMYNLKQKNVRENAIEILKLRGAGHQKKIVALQITSEGIVIYPEQEVFSEME
jgi:KaiC/GvpD/RAD55 family RecA-like ATPase